MKALTFGPCNKSPSFTVHGNRTGSARAESDEVISACDQTLSRPSLLWIRSSCGVATSSPRKSAVLPILGVPSPGRLHWGCEQRSLRAEGQNGELAECCSGPPTGCQACDGDSVLGCESLENGWRSFLRRLLCRAPGEMAGAVHC